MNSCDVVESFEKIEGLIGKYRDLREQPKVHRLKSLAKEMKSALKHIKELEKFRTFESIIKEAPGNYILSISPITSMQKNQGYYQRTLSAIFDVSFYHEDFH